MSSQLIPNPPPFSACAISTKLSTTATRYGIFLFDFCRCLRGISRGCLSPPRHLLLRMTLPFPPLSTPRLQTLGQPRITTRDGLEDKGGIPYICGGTFNKNDYQIISMGRSLIVQAPPRPLVTTHYAGGYTFSSGPFCGGRWRCLAVALSAGGVPKGSGGAGWNSYQTAQPTFGCHDC